MLIISKCCIVLQIHFYEKVKVILNHRVNPYLFLRFVKIYCTGVCVAVRDHATIFLVFTLMLLSHPSFIKLFYGLLSSFQELFSAVLARLKYAASSVEGLNDLFMSISLNM